MYKGLIFLIILAIVFAIVLYRSPKCEGFQNPFEDPSLAQKGVGNIKADPLPLAKMPSSPYDAIAKTTPSPYRDPANEPARYSRIQGAIADLQTFFGFEIANLEDRSDPAFQLPIQTARADLSELQALQSTLERNPGIPSRMTNKKLDDILGNLQYLRNEARLIKNVSTEGFSNYEDEEELLQEGFFNYYGDDEDDIYETFVDPIDIQKLRILLGRWQNFSKSEGFADMAFLEDQIAQISTSFATTMNALQKNTNVADFRSRFYAFLGIFNDYVKFGTEEDPNLEKSAQHVKTFENQKVQQDMAKLAVIANMASPCPKVTCPDVSAQEYDKALEDFKKKFGITIGKKKSKVQRKKATVRQRATRRSTEEKPEVAAEEKPAPQASQTQAVPEVAPVVPTPPAITTQIQVSGQCPRASKAQLDDFYNRLSGEISKLSATNNSDPIMQARIRNLTAIKNSVGDLIDYMKGGTLSANEVPLTTCDIQSSLPVLGNTNAPLPKILTNLGMPGGLLNAFPGGLSMGDSQTIKQLSGVFDKYMDTLTKGASWNFGFEVNYDSPRALEIMEAQQKEAEAIGSMFHKPWKIDVTGLNPSGVPGMEAKSTFDFTPSGSYNKQATAKLDGNTTIHDTGLPGFNRGQGAPIAPKTGNFEWKQRAKNICEQVRLRGMNPADFGCRADIYNDADPNFSWRGYTAMLCSRLETTMDPGLPVTVGCPPSNWPGWKA